MIEPNTQQGKEGMFLARDNHFEVDQGNFSKIPGSPVAYWASDSVLKAYSDGKPLSEVAEPKQGLKTGDNNIFLRLWYEVSWNKSSLYQSEGAKWFPCNKGGEYRRWYGNNDYFIDWYDDGYKLKNFRHPDGRLKSRPQNIQYMKKEGLTYTNISSGNLGIRYSPQGFLFDAAGSMIFTSKDRLMYMLAFLGSKVATSFTQITSPTMSFEVGQLSNIPVIYAPSQEIDELSCDCIEIEKSDWDSFETSWDFKMHPLIPYGIKGVWDADEMQNESDYSKLPQRLYLSACYEAWEEQCNNCFAQLKANEEELNRIFIDIYGLQDELAPEVEDKDVTVRKADLQREIKSFISYAVGCMFGRYSLDAPGLAFAGGEFDHGKYTSFPADRDNIIPICDDEYFEDDIVGRFVRFVETVYGTEIYFITWAEKQSVSLDFGIVSPLMRWQESILKIKTAYPTTVVYLFQVLPRVMASAHCVSGWSRKELP